VWGDLTNKIDWYVRADGGRLGQLYARQIESSVADAVSTGINYFTPSANTAFSIAGRHGSTFVNAAEGGTALTEDTTPTALADLSAADFQIGSTFNGTISAIRVFADDIGDTGLEEVTA